jgi:hypothetical protein
MNWPSALDERSIRITLFVLGLSGWAALFFPFAHRTSRWTVAVLGEFGYLLGLVVAAPFFLAIPISVLTRFRANG